MENRTRKGNETNVLILGASGMLGNALLRYLSASANYAVVGSVRSTAAVSLLPAELCSRLISGIDVENVDSLARLLAVTRPNVVINCVGLVKQLAEADDPLAAIPINSLLPHRLARLCEIAGTRLIHISTDCVFAGTKGMYDEYDVADAQDLYGRSKYLGEVDYSHAVTLRTSLIGHELNSAHSLVGWFLAQEGRVKGFERAIFSGLTTVELARVIRDFIIPRSKLRGVYHVAGPRISKYELLKLVGVVYGKATRVVPDSQLVIDRSLNADRFREATGYVAPDWPEMIKCMFEFHSSGST